MHNEEGKSRQTLAHSCFPVRNTCFGMLRLLSMIRSSPPSFFLMTLSQVLMRAYKFADEDNSGLITKGEFVTLLRALTFFQNLWTVSGVSLSNPLAFSVFRSCAHERCEEVEPLCAPFYLQTYSLRNPLNASALLVYIRCSARSMSTEMSR